MLVQFTGREKEVIDLLLQGKSNKQIALSLNISKSTVEFHLKNVYLKLGVSSRAEAILNLSKNRLWHSTGEKNGVPEYSSQAKHFFDPKEKKAMKNRTTISITLSVVAILAVFGVLIYLRSEEVNPSTLNQSIATNNELALPTNTPRGVLKVPAGASTRYYDEMLLLLQSLEPPFHFAAVFVATDCFVPGSENCAFTEPIPFPDGESFYGPVIWMPDGENGFYYRDMQIPVLTIWNEKLE